MSTLGTRLRQVSELCDHKAHHAAECIGELPGETLLVRSAHPQRICLAKCPKTGGGNQRPIVGGRHHRRIDLANDIHTRRVTCSGITEMNYEMTLIRGGYPSRRCRMTEPLSRESSVEERLAIDSRTGCPACKIADITARGNLALPELAEWMLSAISPACPS